MHVHAKFYLANEHFSPCSANWHFAFGRVSKIFSITKLLLLPRGILQTGQDFCLLSFVINLAWQVSQTKWSWKSRGFVLIINFVWACRTFYIFLRYRNGILVGPRLSWGKLDSKTCHPGPGKGCYVLSSKSLVVLYERRFSHVIRIFLSLNIIFL